MLTRTLLVLVLCNLAVALFPADAAATSCSIPSRISVDFGDADTLTGNTATATDITIECSNLGSATAVTLCANYGPGFGGGFNGADRWMSAGFYEKLYYRFYTDAAHTTLWGHSDHPQLGSPQRIVLPVTQGTASGVVTLYGLLSGAQPTAEPDTYRDTISWHSVRFYYAAGDSLQCDAVTGAYATSQQVKVSAKVEANCLVEADDLDFGSASGNITHNIDASTSLSVTCTAGTKYWISLDDGQAGTYDPANRRMQSGTDMISYGLYTDAARTNAWGSGWDSVFGTASGGGVDLPVYGRVPPQSSVPPGVYTDTVVVTITYL
ncbi:spore coat U domain-containing protein [Hoeflea sp. WL0058]|uniref:Spore coat U domain-containing protein n=1 Tax=Flavimaribacter sediminis TaxID=2865987 RepID=A0AAE2ZQN0_9HYPH|nr:spore coat U domain-containing protein [Flavimaribacter sediminis]MBW8637892.1 spore coat U domain-containing protein [Flavimaribacter sediminis]